MIHSLVVCDNKTHSASLSNLSITTFPFIHTKTIQMLLYLAITADEQYLGRLDPLNMSQQALMECFVSQLDSGSFKAFCDCKGNFKDIKKWKGVKCDDDENVCEVSWIGHPNMNGTLSLQWLPPTIEKLHIDKQVSLLDFKFCVLPNKLKDLYLNRVTLHDELRFDALPPAIERIQIVSSNIRGKLELTAIPETLRHINILVHELAQIDLKCSSEALTQLKVVKGSLKGTLDFRQSPPSLELLNLMQNRLSGELQFAGLPKSLEGLQLNENSFTGTLRFESLPQALRLLDLHDNAFTEVLIDALLPPNLSQIDITAKKSNPGENLGTADFVHLSARVTNVKISHNQLQGTVRLSHLTDLAEIYASYNHFEGGIETSELPANLVILNLSANKLTGNVDLTVLPQNLRILRLEENSFSGTINLNRLPSQFRVLNLSDNQLSGSFTIENAPPRISRIYLLNNRFEMQTLVVYESLKCIPRIDISGNGVHKVTNEKGKAIRTSNVTLRRSLRD